MIENAATAAETVEMRSVNPRSGPVLTEQSLNGQAVRLEHHLGGWIGTGRGWTPWIHIADDTAMVCSALHRGDIYGPLNVDPHPRDKH